MQSSRLAAPRPDRRARGPRRTHPRATQGSGLVWKRYDDLQSLPEIPAVYFWAGNPVAASPANPRAERLSSFAIDDLGEHADDVVLYIGKAAGGLYNRYRKVWPTGWLDEPEAHGHARIINRYRGRLYAAEASACPDQPCRPECDGFDGAATWERRLIPLHLRRTGLVPVVNGGGWFNEKAHYEAARRWAAGAPQ